MKRSDIEKLTIVKLEEHSPFSPSNSQSGPLLSGGDILSEVKPIYSYVTASMTEAGNEILRIAPLNKLIPEEYKARCIPNPYRPFTGKFEMPDDYLRMHTLLMCSWNRPVHEVIQPQHPNFHDQDYDATCGNSWKPVATQEDNFIKYYSVDGECCHHIVEMKYIVRYDQWNEYTDEIGELIALNCAKKVYEVFGNTEQVNTMMAEIKSKLENLQG